jgi:hypothetical protein
VQNKSNLSSLRKNSPKIKKLERLIKYVKRKQTKIAEIKLPKQSNKPKREEEKRKLRVVLKIKTLQIVCLPFYKRKSR